MGVKVFGGIIGLRLKGKVRLTERVEGLTNLFLWVRGILGVVLGGGSGICSDVHFRVVWLCTVDCCGNRTVGYGGFGGL